MMLSGKVREGHSRNRTEGPWGRGPETDTRQLKHGVGARAWAGEGGRKVAGRGDWG